MSTSLPIIHESAHFADNQTLHLIASPQHGATRGTTNVARCDSAAAIGIEQRNCVLRYTLLFAELSPNLEATVHSRYNAERMHSVFDQLEADLISIERDGRYCH